MRKVQGRLSECAPGRRDRSHSVRKLWNIPPISTELRIDCDVMLTETFGAHFDNVTVWKHSGLLPERITNTSTESEQTMLCR